MRGDMNLSCVLLVLVAGVSLVAGSFSPLMWGKQIVDAEEKRAMCNDGTVPMYYYSRACDAAHEARWVVVLGGGGVCTDDITCKERYQRQPGQMSSNYDGTFYYGEGILSPLSIENPSFYCWTKVYIPCCSSDYWTGDTFAISWEFRGKRILRELLGDLSNNTKGLPSIANATDIILAGSGTGGVGVIANLDWVADVVGRKVRVSGIVDNGWLHEVQPYFPNISWPSQRVQEGYKLWGSVLDRNCTSKYPGEPWMCLFADASYPFVRSPLFVQAAQFDEHALEALGVVPPLSSSARLYANTYAAAMRLSLSNVSHVFSPTCYTHDCLLRSSCLSSVLINGTSFQRAMNLWYEEGNRSHFVEEECNRDCLKKLHWCS